MASSISVDRCIGWIETSFAPGWAWRELVSRRAFFHAQTPPLVVFLLGADFKMSTDAERNYAFDQGRTKHAVDHNNRYPYEKAVEYARAECGKVIDTVGWYGANKSKTDASGRST